MTDQNTPIEPGDVVRDNYGRLGIVVAYEPSRPEEDWLKIQEDSRVQKLSAEERWLYIYPFDGGSAVSPESLTERLRPMDNDDFRKAYRAGNGFAQDKLKEVFPERVELILAEDRGEVH